MGKIVIPKHDAEVKNMNAVLKIHYEADDWVTSKVYTTQLKNIIGSDQYPSSYPKKAQVPTYFGFLECKMTSGKRITERRITDSGKKMYEAIISNDIVARQAILMDAIENIVFGRNNCGCVSSESDLEAPDLAIRCILDTGYCTCQEYAYMIWNLHDNGKKYYQSLPEIIKARNSGGIAIQKEAKDYADWKPILALIRWGFLIKADDARQKVMLHPNVNEMYSERLDRIKVYNVDKNGEIVINDEIIEDTVDESVFKPFIISEISEYQLNSGEIQEEIVNVDRQHIFPGDSVLFVDTTMNRLLAYHSYLINQMQKSGSKYKMKLEKKAIVNRMQENLLLEELRNEVEKQEESELHKALLDLFKYQDSYDNIKKISNSNKDIEPINLVIRTLTELEFLFEDEVEFLLSEMLFGSMNYSDVIKYLKMSRVDHDIHFEASSLDLDFNVINIYVNRKVLEWKEKDGKRVLKINSRLKDLYIDQFKRLMIYAVDIQEINKSVEEKRVLPLAIKAIVSDSNVNSEGLETAIINPEINQEIVQGDYIIFVTPEFNKIENYIVFQITRIFQDGKKLKIEIVKHNYINREKESEILEELKEANYGERE